jgi:predicted nucleotidyltransferase
VRRAPGLISRTSIEAYCRAVAREFHPQKIVLFGSYAYGNPTADSDVDLLVILPFRGNDISKAVQIRSRFDTPFPMDLIVRKPDFIAERLRERDMFIELVMKRGRVIYEGEHP